MRTDSVQWDLWCQKGKTPGLTQRRALIQDLRDVMNERNALQGKVAHWSLQHDCDAASVQSWQAGLADLQLRVNELQGKLDLAEDRERGLHGELLAAGYEINRLKILLGKAADVVSAAQACVKNPAWAGICDEDVLLEQALDRLAAKL